jgi:hypothetical protein
MPRFRDDWVIDKVMFDYVGNGQCACCGFSHLFLPNGTADLIGAMSDLETDAAEYEIAALEHHPWPKDLRDQVWADRVRLRQSMKPEMKRLAQFWREHAPEFKEWMLRQENLNRLFQLPRSEIMSVIQQTYKIHSAYAVVLCTVLEQVAFFSVTEYPPDARGDVEISFDEHLQFDKRGGFVLRMQTADGAINQKCMNAWWKRIESLGGPKLLGRNPSKNNDDDGDADAACGKSSAGPSFAMDRRLLRLLIARYWANLLQNKFLTETSKPSDTNEL